MMNSHEYVFDDSLFTYVISDKAIDSFSRHEMFNALNKNIIINLTKKTDYYYSEKSGLKVGIIGFCVDSINRAERSNISQLIVDNCNCINEVIEYSKYFAGKYVIMVEDSNGVFMFSDATSQVGIYYDTTKFMISSNEYLMGKLNNYTISDAAKNIVNSRTDLFQPFPYDVTHFESVKYLVPNHYLNIVTNEVTRIEQFCFENEESYTREEILDKSFEIINNIVKEYVKYYPNIICDLTAGYDSRLNFGFLLNNNVDFITTTSLKNANDICNVDDVDIAASISKEYSVKHNVTTPAVITDTFYNSICDFYDNYFEKACLSSGYNMLVNYGKNAVCIDGNIIGHIGKCFVNRGLSDKYATLIYLMAKQHNTSKETKENLKKHLKDLKSRKGSNIFDLFTLESRCSRWVTNYSIWADVLGIVKLNIYNCRYWQELIMLLPYKYRADNKLLISYYKKFGNNLLDFPINPHEHTDFIYKHPLALFVCTYAKFFLTKLKM